MVAAPPVGPQDWQAPAPSPNTGMVGVVVGAVAIIAVAVGLAAFAESQTRTSDRASSAPVTSRSTSADVTSSITPGPIEVVPGQVPSPYAREVTELSEAEAAYFGNLAKGDCLVGRVTGDEPWRTVPVVPCSEPHVQQVMGFVEVTRDIPDDLVSREMAVMQRCNSLKASHGIPPEVWKNYIVISLPDVDDVAAGVGVAVCWAPFKDTTWTGSLVEGTAVVLDS